MSKTQEKLVGVATSPPDSSPLNIFHHLRHGTAGDANAHVETGTSQDPLVAFEHHLLAHPANRPAAPARLSARSLTVPSSHLGRRPSPSPDARRCMAATEAWTPCLDRCQSWDGQAYRRAMMVRATGILCGSAEANAAANSHESPDHLTGHAHCLDGHHHHNHFHHMHDVNGSCNDYEANRGFSECASGTT
ncbi:hypothetical protein CMQ_4050 [Grosmannia clavigera kw1407]|uniref:Uncharacterized protein n=1 Tax=Grosmannia clavigera (strain kw1407 / UAMH 11150) TaxID=655863 RepID=F0X833_GROCL|nr:uncharacterized protein CMQ_4050 [Grosmannia clavigera kw1407]EFX05981.1 hypothetical protein CMQ_4050 [Grosmannia clavigera kw1407]